MLNVAYIKKETKVTKVYNLKVRFDQHTLNTYLSFEDVEPKEYLDKYAMWDTAHHWLAEILATPRLPPWITIEVPIHTSTLTFEANGWQTIVYSKLDPSQNQTFISIPRAILVASIMVGYPTNVGAVMLANILVIAR